VMFFISTMCSPVTFRESFIINLFSTVVTYLKKYKLNRGEGRGRSGHALYEHDDKYFYYFFKKNIFDVVPGEYTLKCQLFRPHLFSSSLGF